MNDEEVKRLREGDEVFWMDPDAGACSRRITIRNIEVSGEIVRIEGDDDSVVEAIAHELRQVMNDEYKIIIGAMLNVCKDARERLEFFKGCRMNDSEYDVVIRLMTVAIGLAEGGE